MFWEGADVKLFRGVRTSPSSPGSYSRRRVLGGFVAVLLATVLIGACGSTGKQPIAHPTNTTIAQKLDRASVERLRAANHAGTGTGAGAAASSPGDAASGGSNPTGKIGPGSPTPGGSARGGSPAVGGGGSTGGSGGATSDGNVPPRTGGSSPVFGMARSSVQNVVLLHNLAVGLGRANGLPGDVTLTESARIADQLRADQRAAELLEKTDTYAVSLAAVQGLYAALAQELHTAAGATKKVLPARFTKDLAAADKQWRAALTVIGRSAGVDLLVNVPPLLMPQASVTTIPPPPK